MVKPVTASFFDRFLLFYHYRRKNDGGALQN
jgi:hypothetical protein